MVVNLSIFPIGKAESLSPYVAEAVKVIDKSGLPYRLTSMGTILEGDWDRVMSVIKKARQAVLKKCGRVYLTISIDDRGRVKGAMDRKVRSIEKVLKKKLKK